MLMSKIFNEDGGDTERLIVNYDYAIRNRGTRVLIKQEGRAQRGGATLSQIVISHVAYIIL